MAIIFVDTVMRKYPHLAVFSLEIGGTCIDDNCEVVDVLDAVKDPNRLYFIDVNSDKCLHCDPEELYEDDSEDSDHEGVVESETNAGGVTKEETIRDLIERYTKEDRREETAEELLKNFRQKNARGTSNKDVQVSLRDSLHPNTKISARAVFLEHHRGIRKLK